MKKLISPAVILCLVLASCAERPVVYSGSGLSVLHLQGVKDSIPENLKIGYDRTEYAWLPDGEMKNVKAGFDSEYKNFAGVAINDLLVTGAAASGEEVAEPETGNQSEIVSTNTRFNLGLEIVPSDGVSPSFNAGFKRSVLALFPKTKGDLPSTYTDLSIHTSGFPGVKTFTPKGLPADRHLTAGNGARVVQTIATGAAATELGKRNAKEINERIGAGY